MKDNKETILMSFLLIGIILFLFIGWSYLLDSKRECEERGGALVKGVMGYTCVAGPYRK